MNLTNQFLVATPQMHEPQFERSVVYICQHDANGAMGLVVNRSTNPKLSEIFSQLEIEFSQSNHLNDPIFAGGPVHPENGFVLHRPVGQWKSSMIVTDNVAVTTSKDILEALAENQGPEECIISLGYAGWEQSQLESEIGRNDWFVVRGDESLIFDVPVEERWESALKMMGISDLSKLSLFSGHA